MQFYFFPFFFKSILFRFQDQFEPNKNGSWQYLPEHRASTHELTEDERIEYTTRFRKRLIYNAAMGSVFLLLLTCWILYVRISVDYFIWGIAILFSYYTGAYHGVYSAFYSPEKENKYHNFYEFLFPTVFALIIIANYFNWSLEDEDIRVFMRDLTDKIGLSPYFKQYPYVIFGVLITLFFFLRMFYSVYSVKPAGNKRRKQIRLEREESLKVKEKPWDKTMREAQEKEKLKKKEKKKRKKEMKKQGKVFPKKYKDKTK